MLSGSNSKNSSSEDDLLSLEFARKKHFLDYTMDECTAGHINHAIGDSPAPTNNISSNSINNGTTGNNTQSIELKKKICERGPSTSKMATSSDKLSSSSKTTNPPNNVDSVYSILSMLGSINSADITSKFLEFSKTREMCAAMRLSGCISLLVQIIHSVPYDKKKQQECVQTLHNIISCQSDDKVGRREARVLKLNEQLFSYCDALRAILKNELSDNADRYPIQAIGVLMKISFDEDHRYAMCQLGALQTISSLIQLDHEVHGPNNNDINCITMRRYSGMCLTNLTFGDGNNKALLCSNKNFMKALVTQINSSSDELVQVTASVIRNLSWRADAKMKEVLNEIGTVEILTVSAMKCSQENTLKAILSALWNLSNHCAKNKAEICEIEGSIEFLVDMLMYEAASKTTSVIENAGGILRNISTHIALHENLRVILRKKNCLMTLLQQLKSSSLTVVSNSCGTLGNLSSHSVEDQNFLRDNGAIPMLRSLIYSKHKMISTGSTIALRHLLSCKTNVAPNENLDSVAKMMDLKELPTLNVRKQRALEHELNLAQENCKPDKDDFSPDKDDETKELKVEDVDDEDEEAPTNFCKFDNDQEEGEKSEYQESNLDQITDYSIRYAENQTESDDDEDPKPVVNEEDIVKCYNTEGTPHAVLSGAGSMSDLRKEKLNQIIDEKKSKGKFSGHQSPEKTINYCVEGTPGNFSRNDSLSDLEDNVDGKQPKASSSKANSKVPPPPLTILREIPSEKDSIAATPKSVTFLSLAEETPLMFSRTSSMGSLSSAEPVCVDDKSSVFSDFSRLASGIISPSELPDSPTQSIPQSPSRLNARSHQKHVVASRTPPLPVMREVAGGNDSTNAFHIENTPAAFSYAASSLSNLSFDDEPKISTDAISKDFQLMKMPSCEDDEGEGKIKECQPPPADTAEHSDLESGDDEILLESCINIGMNRVVKLVDNQEPRDTQKPDLSKVEPRILKENPIDMMRAGAPLLPPYLPVVDEFNRFIVEDSPCNFSLMSGLSAITIESNSANQPSNPGSSFKQNQPIKKAFPAQDFNDSLSSLSIESEDDGNLLSQAIAAGSKTQETFRSGSHPINIPVKPRSADLCNGNDSISSVDSCGKDDANSILEQCIQSGINNVVKKDKRTLVTSSPKRSMLPTYNNKPGPSKVVKTDRKVQDKRDEELLQECINTGIMKNTRQEQIAETPSADPKNVETTSVVIAKNSARVPIITAGVELKAEEKSTKCKPKTDRDENIASKSQPSRQESGMTPSGFDLNLSMGSVDENVLERSNEYPAVKMSIGAYVDLDDDSMNISNEFMMESEKISRMENKHKDPDLMMKSVDRLTHELVSTAEYLRRNTISDEISKMSGSNTWTDENSFPSISMSAAPMIASTNEDVTIATDQIYTLPEEIADQKFEDKTPMNENYIFEVNEEKIHVDFRVGGEIGAQPVAKVNFMSFGPMSIETCSTMSNSTIVQVEAKRIANKLNSMTNRLMDSTSSLDLENVRPPSSMDCISMSSFHESTMQQSPMRKKPLMPGIVAKRALGHQMFSASAESVNIDSIRPPSIMDELLDSMISVDSIVSEIVDPITMGISNYETAISDMEDSLTMRSCQDLSKDEETLTANSSDFSSVESTPKKRNLTPRQKRQSEKDRYKTYTIQVDMLLKESSTESARKSLNARQRRQEDRTRFETQVISPKLDDSDKTYNIEDDLSIQAMTKNFKFIRAPINHTTIPKNNGEIRNKLNQIRQNTEESLEEERQNSETESQRDLKNSLTYEANLSVEIESPTDKPKLTKNSYISPYRMTSRLTPMKNKSVKVTKTPIIAKIVTRKSPVDLKPAIQKKPAGLRVNTNIKKTFNQPSNVPKSAPVIATTKEAPSIVRQGTFVKDEPTMENVPIVVDLPQKSTISKLKPPTKVSSPKILEKTPLAKKVSNLPTSISQLKFRSNSNASMKTPILTPVRSNTGINLNNPKKSVTSKIAGIWKSGEKKDSLLKKPSISASASQLNPPGKLFGSSARNVGKNKEIMKRSSTYDELA